MAVTDLSKDFLGYLRTEDQIAFDCPSCGETYKLTEVQLYYIPDRKRDFLAKFRKKVSEWEENKDKLIQDRLKRSRSSIMGQVVEQIRPFLPRMKYEPGDLRSIWKPIDYVCFNGLSLKRDVNSITFIDVKSGRSHLTDEQFSIKKAIEHGHVDFDTIEFKPEELLSPREAKPLTA
jgi:predicted Holliday junction resolvase-like endonuclease